MHESPLVAVGQSACQLASEIRSLHRHEAPPFPEILCDEHRRLSGKRRGSTSLQKEVGIIRAPVSWVEGLEDEITKIDLLDSLRSSLEQCGNPQRMTLISNALGTLMPTILEDISCEFPTLSILSILLVPMGGAKGINNLNFVLNTSFSLEYSEGCILRGPEDLKHLLPLSINQMHNNRSYKLGPYNSKYTLLNRFMATDILFALRNNQWLLSHRSGDPFVDCRTSVWKSLLNSYSKTSRKHTLGNNVDVIRSCAASLRSSYLHLECPINRYRLFNIHTSSSLIQRSPGSKIEYIVSKAKEKDKLSLGKLDANINAALKWATPAMSWPSSVNITLQHNVQPSFGSVDFSFTDDYDQFVDDCKICAIGFQSSFAKAYILSVLANAEQVVSKGAYLHRFHEGSITSDDLVGAVEALQLHFRQ